VLQTLVVGFAIAVAIGMLALAFLAAWGWQRNLERRAKAAATDGRRLSLDEQQGVAWNVRKELATPALKASEPTPDHEDRGNA
jgi:hypothetical protein